jgi:hypothetical protein
VALLEACIADLERGEHVERALRLLGRYTQQTFGATPAAWHGRMYPDMEKETPYIIVSLQRQGM